VFNRAGCAALCNAAAQLDQVGRQYNQTLLDAVREVADVVAHWRGARARERRAADRARGRAALLRAHQPTRIAPGSNNYLSGAVEPEPGVEAQGLRAQLQARRLSFSVDLVRALGGGYSRAHHPLSPMARSCHHRPLTPGARSSAADLAPRRSVAVPRRGGG